MSTDLWEYHQEKEMIRKINAAQAVLNQKKSQQQANENTAMDLDQPEQTTHTNQTIDPKLQNAVKKLMDQRLKQEKSKHRKNSSADAKNQASRATNNGHESNKNSTRGRDRSNTKSSNNSNKNKQKNQERSRSHGRSRERSRERNRNTSRDKTRNNSPHPSSLRNGRYKSLERTVQFQNQNGRRQNNSKDRQDRRDRENQGGSSYADRNRGSRRN